MILHFKTFILKVYLESDVIKSGEIRTHDLSNVNFPCLGARQIRENQNPPNSGNKNRQTEEPHSESSRNENGKVRVIVE